LVSSAFRLNSVLPSGANVANRFDVLFGSRFCSSLSFWMRLDLVGRWPPSLCQRAARRSPFPFVPGFTTSGGSALFLPYSFAFVLLTLFDVIRSSNSVAAGSLDYRASKALSASMPAMNFLAAFLGDFPSFGPFFLL